MILGFIITNCIYHIQSFLYLWSFHSKLRHIFFLFSFVFSYQSPILIKLMEHFTLLLSLVHVIYRLLVHAHGFFVGCCFFNLGLFFIELCSNDAVRFFVDVIYFIFRIIVFMLLLDLESGFHVVVGFLMRCLSFQYLTSCSGSSFLLI